LTSLLLLTEKYLKRGAAFSESFQVPGLDFGEALYETLYAG
jgi:hypothetical protein